MIPPTFTSSRTALLSAACVLFLTSLPAQQAAGASRVSSASAVGLRVPRAHEVPADVSVQAYIRPRGDRLTVLVRVPLESMRDMELPLRDQRYLALEAPGLPGLLRDAAGIWIADYVAFQEDGRGLGPEEVVAARISLPSDRSFTAFESALAHVRGRDPVPERVDLPPGQALLDVLLEVPIASDSARFSVDPELAHLGVDTRSVLHFLPPGGGERVFTYTGDPGVLHLDPSWSQALWRFVTLGFFHILGGWDHLLFILCLVLPYRNLRGLIPVVTAFTLAHSLTLAAAALGMAPTGLWFPPLVETLIALSIVWMALENIVGARLGRRWRVAFGFGLIHGFGFSFLLRESLQLSGGQLLTSLVAFNAGVELGQLAVLVAAIPLLEWFFGRVVAERMGVIVASALVLHTAWHWMTDRGAAFMAHDVPPLAWDASLLARVMRWGALALVATGMAWAMSGWVDRREPREEWKVG